jgi:hypothetical protein
MGLPPIRPPSRMPRLWLEHPELAPPRRRASAAFRAGASLAGLGTRFPARSVCGARTKRGRQCKAPKVLGSNRCRHHGGGRVLLRRARQTLARTRSRSVMAKCLWYLEKAQRNRVRQHLKAGERQLAQREAQAEQATAGIARALREGGIIADLVRRLYRAGGDARPYRPQDVGCALGAFLTGLSNGDPPLMRFEAFAAELRLNETERLAAAATIGVRLPREAEPALRGPVEHIEHELAVRSLRRRARNKHPR